MEKELKPKIIEENLAKLWKFRGSFGSTVKSLTSIMSKCRKVYTKFQLNPTHRLKVNWKKTISFLSNFMPSCDYNWEVSLVELCYFGNKICDRLMYT